jgi:hypothetical protein
MTTEQMRAYKNAQPFVPFAIHLADGREISVKHPENLMVPIAPQPARTIGVLNVENAIETIDLLLVASLRPLNGHTSRTRRSR